MDERPSDLLELQNAIDQLNQEKAGLGQTANTATATIRS